MTVQEIDYLNKQYQAATPQEIIQSILETSKRPILTTNFGPYSASLVHAVTQFRKDIPVVWGDSGYNMTATYRFSRKLSQELNLNLHIYTPKYTRAYLDEMLGDFMADEKGHKKFTDVVKIEPLQRAFETHKPDVWFTNIRKGQTSFRDGLNIFSLSKSGVIKVSPFFYYSDQDLDRYLNIHDLPNELNYFDPTKIFKNRECGLHLSKI